MAQQVVHIYNWSDYIGEETLAKFEAKTGHQANLPRLRHSNETLEGKNCSPAAAAMTWWYLQLIFSASRFAPAPSSRRPQQAEQLDNLDPAWLRKAAGNQRPR